MGGQCWSGFCVVGIGAHARTKILPALAANGHRIAGMVTRRADLPPQVPAFTHLESALAALPEDTAYVLTSPPHVHFRQAMVLIEAVRDLIVEKPAFIAAAEAEEAIRGADAHGTVLVEAFMHRHTSLYGRLLQFWREQRTRIAGVDIDFLIPRAPADTFREQEDIGSSLLYDIGCYPVSLLRDLELPLNGLKLAEVTAAGRPNRELCRITGEAAGIPVSIRIGIAPEYTNCVTLHLLDGGVVRFSPFFYGRAGERKIEWPGGAPETSLVESNAFEAMFAVPRETWAADQPFRLARMLETTACLERLGRGLAEHRRSALL